MRNIPLAMLTDLQSGATTHCRCWKLESFKGVTGHTNHDRDLTFDSITFKALQGLSASDVKYSDDLNADTQDLYGVFRSAGFTIEEIRRGVYDNAKLSEYVVDWTNVTKRFLLRVGFIGKLRRNRHAFQAEVRSLTSVLGFNKGEVYSTTCSTWLGSPKCKVNLAAYTDAGVVSVVSSTTQFGTTSSAVIARSSSWYNFGFIEWLTGANVGVKTYVKSNILANGTMSFVLNSSTPYSIQIGDTFNAVAGCNKSLEHCRDKYNNKVNFRGFNRIPGGDMLITVAKRDGSNDGGSLF